MTAANGQQGAGNSQNTVTVSGGGSSSPDTSSVLVETMKTFGIHIPQKVEETIRRAIVTLVVLFSVISGGGSFVLWNKLCAVEEKMDKQIQQAENTYKRMIEIRKFLEAEDRKPNLRKLQKEDS